MMIKSEIQDCDRGQANAPVLIVTPALADSNNGNWQTARRWALHLRPTHAVSVASDWDANSLPPGTAPAVMLALHAGRSAPAIAAWASRSHSGGLGVVLTGTDLYRDLNGPDASAHQRVLSSLGVASKIVVLQDQALHTVPADLRHKARVIYQSSTTRQALQKPKGRLRAVMVGHLRHEKDPLTLMKAMGLISPQDGISVTHIGQALDHNLAHAALETQSSHSHYQWANGLPHETTRKRIQRAHVLVHTSRLEGGAHVIMEAVCSGTPVLASRMAGNVGMLGADYSGYFEVGDAQGLAASLRRARHEPAFIERLKLQCQTRAALFEPAREQAALRGLVDELTREVCL